MADWYRDHGASPDAYPESEYLSWAQDQGLHVDAAGNVGHGPPEACTNPPGESCSDAGCPLHGDWWEAGQ
jgi:hypothetical protein